MRLNPKLRGRYAGGFTLPPASQAVEWFYLTSKRWEGYAVVVWFLLSCECRPGFSTGYWLPATDYLFLHLNGFRKCKRYVFPKELRYAIVTFRYRAGEKNKIG